MIHKRLQVIRFLPGLAVLLCGMSGASAVEFAASIEKARESEDGKVRRPIVLTFSARWCGWCRKMDSTTFQDPAVDELAKQFLFVKVDSEGDPALAARFQVRGLPHTFVLDGNDRAIGSQPGYLSAEALVKFVNESVANPQPIDGVPEELLDQLARLEEAEDRAAVVRSAVERLAQQDAAGRETLVAVLVNAGPPADAELTALLQDERLAVRAAAAGVLARITEGALPFDPFADADVREAQAEEWRRWAQARPPSHTRNE
jgi:thioredoxin-like negative regulator of GroEL